jgi:hypothetical protein
LLVLLRWHNALAFPSHWGFDNYGHGRYLESVALQGRLPTPQEVWPGNHPPLYYQATALLARAWGRADPPGLRRAGQVLSALSSVGALGFVFLLARRLVPGSEVPAVLWAGSIPAEVMASAMLYNAPFGYLLDALFLWLLVIAWQRPAPSAALEAALGLAAGLAMLARLEGVLCLGLLAALWGGRLVWRRAGVGDATLGLALAVLVALSLSGWFYQRNLALFGRPLAVASAADVLPYWYTQGPFYFPGFRSLSYYLQPAPAGLAHPHRPWAYPSVWTSAYASLWWDYWNLYFPRPDPARGRVMLALGLVPCALLLLGLPAAWRCRARGWPLWASLALTLLYFLVMNVAAPLYAQAKGSFLYPAFPAAALGAALGLRSWQARWPRGAPALELLPVVVGLAVVFLFWY